MKKILYIVFMILFVSAAHAQTYVSNSADWQDVYSTMLFSKIEGGSGYFLVSTRHSTLLINQLNKQNELVVFSSRENPYVVGYESVLESRGFEDVEEVRANNLNLELAQRLGSDITDFLVLDDSYGYNAISVAPYAAISDTYVLFANRRNIGQVVGYLEERDVDSLILYGQTDREVKEALASFDPDVINQGDRFLDNQEIVERYQDVHRSIHGEPKRQAILTNGEFIENEIMSGVEPVVFIGRANVPDQVREYIRESDIDIGILIGNELIGSATFIRRELGISVFVKFAQSARAPSAAISPVEDLDRFYLPRYVLNLDIFRIQYNTFGNWVEVTYQNLVDLSSYLKGTITIRWEGGTQIIGDEDPVFIDKGAFKTIIYRTDADGASLERMEGNITADVFTIFGESPRSLEYSLRKTVQVESIDIQDASQIEFGNVLFDRRSGNFLVEIRNIGEVDTFVDVELVDIMINDELVTVGGEEVAYIISGESSFIEIPVELAEEDLEDNPKVRVRAYYGERERGLIKSIEGEFSYGYTGFGYVTGQMLKDIGKNAILYAPVIVIILLIFLILGMKKKCPHCGEINKLRTKHCSKCGADI